jgi:hypothetical protein
LAGAGLSADFGLGFGRQSSAEVTLPVEQATVTMILPLFSGRRATSKAATTLGPSGNADQQPSSLAKPPGHGEGVVIGNLDALGDLGVGLWRPSNEGFLGTNPAPVPWILCGPGLTGWPASV